MLKGITEFEKQICVKRSLLLSAELKLRDDTIIRMIDIKEPHIKSRREERKGWVNKLHKDDLH